MKCRDKIWRLEILHFMRYSVFPPWISSSPLGFAESYCCFSFFFFVFLGVDRVFVLVFGLWPLVD